MGDWSFPHGLTSFENFPPLEAGIASTSVHDHNPIGSFHLHSCDDPGHHATAASNSSMRDGHQSEASQRFSEHQRMQSFRDAPDVSQLANLPEKTLQDLGKAVAEAVAKKKSVNVTQTLTKKGLINTGITNTNKKRDGSQDKYLVLHCQECDATFRRNKDRTRHIKTKHQKNEGYECPIIDCVMGRGHSFTRSDKLRDHLRGKAVSSRTWRCVLPGCSESGVSKLWWLDHVKDHDYRTRTANRRMLTNYGYEEVCGEYLYRIHLCAQRGCPYGTDSSAVMQEHLLIPHDGAHCPCPIPDCQIVLKDWEAVAQHVASYHSFKARREHNVAMRDGRFWYAQSAFTCPIPSCNKVLKRAEWSPLRHLKDHKFEELLASAKSVVESWLFCYDNHYWRLRRLHFKLLQVSLSKKQIFALLAFTDAEVASTKNLEDLDRLCLEKGINIA